VAGPRSALLIDALAGLAAGSAAAPIMATGGAVIADGADLIVEGDFAKFTNGIANEVVRGGRCGIRRGERATRRPRSSVKSAARNTRAWIDFCDQLQARKSGVKAANTITLQ